MNLDHRAHTHARVGRMTAAMRAAVVPNVPKALRVACVSGGRIIDERIFRERIRVDEWHEALRFDVERDVWILCVPTGATGHVLTREGRIEIGPHGSRVKLDDSSRGKIIVGRQTFLFQLVVPPPRPSRPQLPLSTRRAHIDWALTVIVAFSFLLHFGFVGSIFSDWLDPVVGDEGAIVGLVDLTTKLPMAIVEDHEDDTGAKPSATTPDPSTTKSHEVSHAQTSAASADVRAASLAHEAESMKMDLLAVFGGTSAVQGALSRSDVPIGNLDAIAAQSMGATPTSGELSLATGGVVLPGSHGLTRLGDGRTSTEGTTQIREVAGPTFDMSTRIYDPSPIIDIEGPIARLRPSFRSCYTRKGIAIDPTMEGKLTIDIAIAPNGDVKDVTKVSGSGLSLAVESCIIERAHNTGFTAPGGTGTHARVPIIFRQQH